MYWLKWLIETKCSQTWGIHWVFHSWYIGLLWFKVLSVAQGSLTCAWGRGMCSVRASLDTENLGIIRQAGGATRWQQFQQDRNNLREHGILYFPSFYFNIFFCLWIRQTGLLPSGDSSPAFSAGIPLSSTLVFCFCFSGCLGRDGGWRALTAGTECSLGLESVQEC